MEEDPANLSISEEEEIPFRGQDNADAVEEDFWFWLVGKVFTNNVVNFPSLRNTLADLWHPLRGVTISDIGDKRILFRFFFLSYGSEKGL